MIGQFFLERCYVLFRVLSNVAIEFSPAQAGSTFERLRGFLSYQWEGHVERPGIRK